MPSKKIAVISKECVACGCCVKVCPINAMAVHKGKIALPDKDKCAGCGKCESACPACVISLIQREVQKS